MSEYEALGCLALIFVTSYVVYRHRALRHPFERLLNMFQIQCEASVFGASRDDGFIDGIDLSKLSDRLGRAGYFTRQERRFVVLASTVAVAFLTLALSVEFGFFGSIAGVYLGTMSVLYYVRYKTSEYQREVMFQLPLTLEALILLVESGLSILPALAALIGAEQQNTENNAVTRIFGLVYQKAAAGTPLSDALRIVADAVDERVFRHVLLHLDVSGKQGGELIPSLRSLSDHTHTEWKLSVDGRVRRLESLVVFPVFTAVMGLICLAGSVPAISVFELSEKMAGGAPKVKTATSVHAQVSDQR